MSETPANVVSIEDSPNSPLGIIVQRRRWIANRRKELDAIYTAYTTEANALYNEDIALKHAEETVRALVGRKKTNG